MAITLPSSGTGGGSNTTSGTTFSTTVPAGAAAGDVLVVAAAAERSAIPTVNLNGSASGWNTVRSESQTNTSTVWVWKRLVSGDLGGTIQLSYSSTRGFTVSTATVRGAGDPVYVNQAWSASTSAVFSKTGPTFAPATDSSLAIALWTATPIPATGSTAYSGYTWTSSWTKLSEHVGQISNLYDPEVLLTYRQLGTSTAGVTQTAETVGNGTIKFESYAGLLVFPPAVNAAPTVSAGADQTATVSTVVTLAGTATDTDGTIASRQWTALTYPGSAPTITNATANTATFTPATAGVYTFQFSATDNSGATSTKTCTVYVPAAAATVISEGENSGAWTGTYTDLADVSDSTYVQSSGSGTNTFRLAPVTQNSSLVITVRAGQTGTGASLTVTLLQGTSTIGTWTLASLTTTPTDYPLALTSTQVAAITDWNALDVRLS